MMPRIFGYLTKDICKLLNGETRWRITTVEANAIYPCYYKAGFSIIDHCMEWEFATGPDDSCSESTPVNFAFTLASKVSKIPAFKALQWPFHCSHSTVDPTQLTVFSKHFLRYYTTASVTEATDYWFSLMEFFGSSLGLCSLLVGLGPGSLTFFVCKAAVPGEQFFPYAFLIRRLLLATENVFILILRVPREIAVHSSSPDFWSKITTYARVGPDTPEESFATPYPQRYVVLGIVSVRLNLGSFVRRNYFISFLLSAPKKSVHFPIRMWRRARQQ
ncbi:hypothetical protein EVAR_34394_1 [Eumeta japonica]|uniref:Uncharacterized protein n=1 Tax=Eumeta variegata TaxID=151549 RepID=A0A4C1WXG6_EUMVA|nr:hypothetical protein EVAR_34394_1 [Eumeta japonica]